jgi:hypothetical protein
MKEEAGIPRSPGSRIDISRSLALGRSQKASTESAPTQANTPSRTEPQQSTPSTPPPISDAAKVSLSAALANVSSQPAEPVIGLAQFSERVSIPSSREAAKASYLRQDQAPPVPPGDFAASSGPPTQAEETPPSLSAGDLDTLLTQLRRSFNEDDVPDVDTAPAGDSPEDLLPLARKYVTLLEPHDEPYTDEVRREKVQEVVKFYSAPSRQGRLKSLVNEL